MPQHSRAQAFFDAIRASASPYEFLQRMVGRPLENFESEYLDFKGADQLEPQRDDLRAAWSKALSGFANSDGGVLIWGIDAPSKSNAPENLSLVPDLARFNARLHELLRDATDPPVQNVQIEPYARADQSNRGFIVCIIPRSPWRPHKAKFSKNEYYIRAGDNHVPASQSVLRALFHPESLAQLEIIYRVSKRKATLSSGTDIVVDFWLHNKGPATAQEVFVLYEVAPNAIATNADSVWRATSSGRPGNAVMATRPFHPTEMLKLIAALLGQVESQGQNRLNAANFEFSFQVYALNQEPQKFVARITSAGVDDPGNRAAVRQ